MTKTKVLLAPVLAIVAIAVILAIGSAGTQRAAAGQSAAPGLVTASSVYGVFRAPASTNLTAAELAGRVRAVAGVPPRAAPDPSLTRMLRSDASGRMYAMASDTAICLHVEAAVGTGVSPGRGSTSCGSLADPHVRSRRTTSTLDGGRWHFSALVPDGIRSLKVQTRNGEGTELDVVDNAVSRVFEAEPTVVTWTLADGTTDSLDPWSSP